jgi:hypothetical protein
MRGVYCAAVRRLFEDGIRRVVQRIGFERLRTIEMFYFLDASAPALTNPYCFPSVATRVLALQNAGHGWLPAATAGTMIHA